MKRYIVVLLSIFGSTCVYGDPMVVTIPADGWHLLIDVPPIMNLDSKYRRGRFQLTGSETVTGITFSVFTEKASDASNDRCRDENWSKTAGNPIIDQATVQKYSSDVFSAVTYNIDGEYRGEHVKASNGHFYFVKANKCVDVHVSKYPYVHGDEEVIRRTGKSIRVLERLQ